MYRSTVDEQQFAPAALAKAPATVAASGESGVARINAVLTSRGVAIACITGEPCGSRNVIARPIIVAVDDSIAAAHLADVAYRSDDMHPAHLGSILGRLLVEALKAGCADSDPFVRHITLALFALHGNALVDAGPAEPVRGTLKAWQEKLAKEMLGADMHGAASLSRVAQACGLSVSHFSRAFKRCTGMSPHRWSLTRRLERAKRLLMKAHFSLADVAFECGFCEQSHLTHAFSREFGLSPGAWRKIQRTRRSDKAAATPSFSRAAPLCARAPSAAGDMLLSQP
jgi:AraC-like DNA-binding protein